MNLKEYLSVISGFLFIIGFIPYIKAIVQRKTKASKITWIIWASLDTLILLGMLSEGFINGLVVGAAISGWTVAILAIRYGDHYWTNLDKFYLIGAILSIILWKTLDSPTLSILTSLLVMLIGFIPTILSAWKKPSHEDKVAWTIFWISSFIAIISIAEWKLIESSQPITFFAMDTIMLYAIFVRPIFRSSNQKSYEINP